MPTQYHQSVLDWQDETGRRGFISYDFLGCLEKRKSLGAGVAEEQAASTEEQTESTPVAPVDGRKGVVL